MSSTYPAKPVRLASIYSDTNGSSDITAAYIYIKDPMTRLPTRGVYLYYDTATNKLYLLDTSLLRWIGGFSPGEDKTIENFYCKLSCKDTSTFNRGTTLTISWSITFKTTNRQGNYDIYLNARDRANTSSGLIKKGTITIRGPDITAPTAVTVTDDGVATQDKTSLHAVWSSSYDTESGISQYQYAIGTYPNSTDIVGWTQTGLEREVTHKGLSLTHGVTYYISVRVLDNVGNISPVSSSDGIAIAGSPAAITEIAATSDNNFHQDSPIRVTIEASDPEGDIIEYRCLVNGNEAKAWGPVNSFSLQPSLDIEGPAAITVEARTPNELTVSKQTQVFVFKKPVTTNE
jgi:hypothetical protein